MVKYKLRLALTISLALLGCILLYKMSFSDSKLTYYNDYGGLMGHGVQLRKLNQPFTWNEDQQEDQDNKAAEGTETSADLEAENRTSVCRNSVQGRVLIADDLGYVCTRDSVLSSGCCNANSSSSVRYACQECHQTSGCCKMYEHCISCCMDPNKKPILMNLLNEARSLKNLLLLSVSDHFELCQAKCRTSSSSVQHENIYINPRNKHCFMRDPTSALGGGNSEQEQNEQP